MDTNIGGESPGKGGQAPVPREENKPARLLEVLQGSQIVKVVLVVCLTLILQIPISMIHSTITERKARNNQAMKEVANKWGREQKVMGPFITVPFQKKVVQVRTNNGFSITGKPPVAIGYAHFLAEDLHIEAQTDNFFGIGGFFRSLSI